MAHKEIATESVEGSAAKLRGELLKRACSYVRSHALEAYSYRSRGNPPTTLFKSFMDNGQHRHGNFDDESFAAIQRVTNWNCRLNKPHTRKKALESTDALAAKELDSCTSSDALLMNIFCHPSIQANEELAELLGFKELPIPEFGLKAKLPLMDGDEPRSTEIDMLLNGDENVKPVFVEAKLTERDFVTKEKIFVERYRDFSNVFDGNKFRSIDGMYQHYQLLRNILTAHRDKGRFILICDHRRPDLKNAFNEVVETLICPDLASRCKVLTWQNIARVVTEKLKIFLDEKYGIKG